MHKLTKFSSFIRKLIIDKNYDYSTRKRKTDILDAVTFNLLCTQKGKTQDAVCGNINELNERYNKKKKHISRQSFSARNDQLTVDFYKKTYDSINKYTDLNFYKEKYSYEVFAVDGTDSNLRQILIEKNKENVSEKENASPENVPPKNKKKAKNIKKVRSDGFKLNKKSKSITALNIGIYNVTRNYPITIEMVKHKAERRAYIDFMREKNLKEGK